MTFIKGCLPCTGYTSILNSSRFLKLLASWNRHTTNRRQFAVCKPYCLVESCCAIPASQNKTLWWAITVEEWCNLPSFRFTGSSGQRTGSSFFLAGKQATVIHPAAHSRWHNTDRNKSLMDSSFQLNAVAHFMKSGHLLELRRVGIAAELRRRRLMAMKIWMADLLHLRRYQFTGHKPVRNVILWTCPANLLYPGLYKK
jgi:hypothetical protein